MGIVPIPSSPPLFLHACRDVNIQLISRAASTPVESHAIAPLGERNGGVSTGTPTGFTFRRGTPTKMARACVIVCEFAKRCSLTLLLSYGKNVGTARGAMKGTPSALR